MTVLTPEQIQTLELCNERVARLERKELARRVTENPSYTLNFMEMLRREWPALDGVTEEAVDAFVLNLRLLIQNTDGISIRCLWDKVYSGPNVPVSLRDAFADARQDWSDYRAADSVFLHPVTAQKLSQGELFDILTYGMLAHVNSDKVELARVLTRQGAVSAIMASWYMSALRVLLQTLRTIRDLNMQLLEHSRIQATQATPA
jgi:hypothetical protein